MLEGEDSLGGDAIPDLNEFLCHVSRETDRERTALNEYSRIQEDLGFDSVDTYELMLIVEELGFAVNDEDVLGWESLGDIHRWMSSRRRSDDHPPGCPGVPCG